MDPKPCGTPENTLAGAAAKVATKLEQKKPTGQTRRKFKVLLLKRELSLILLHTHTILRNRPSVTISTKRTSLWEVDISPAVLVYHPLETLARATMGQL